MIVTITINPAIDKSTAFNKLVPEKKIRCSEMLIEAGGGGINVSKAIKELGGESIAVFPSGGNNGKFLEEILSTNNIAFHAFPVAHETRENFTATELSVNAQYRFVMPGGSITDQELEECFRIIK
jgi:6-phosphofructokinase 2